MDKNCISECLCMLSPIYTHHKGFVTRRIVARSNSYFIIPNPELLAPKESPILQANVSSSSEEPMKSANLRECDTLYVPI